VSATPLEHDAEREARVRECAYRLWEADGRPHGRDVEFWIRARELIAGEENPPAEQSPEAIENIAGPSTNQADAPRPRRRRRV
jgi:hypothetical protein